MPRKITQDYLKSVLDYNPEIGVFVWRYRNDTSPQRNKNFSGKVAGSIGKKGGYIKIKIDGEYYSAHRLAWLYMTGIFPTEIDHIDLDGCNNRFSNLREVNRRQNQCNRRKPKNNTSGYKGVCWEAGKWRARIKFGTNYVHLGRFSDLEAAHAAYCAAAQEYHGRFKRVA